MVTVCCVFGMHSPDNLVERDGISYEIISCQYTLNAVQCHMDNFVFYIRTPLNSVAKNVDLFLIIVLHLLHIYFILQNSGR